MKFNLHNALLKNVNKNNIHLFFVVLAKYFKVNIRKFEKLAKMLKNICHFIIIIFLVISCEDPHPGRIPLAEVGTQILYLDDVKKVFPSNISYSDSIVWVDDFIMGWIRKQLVIVHAEKNLSEEQKNMDDELTQYRNSLLIYRYKAALLQQKMDTTITADEINRYYEEYKDEFILTDNLMKAVYLKIPIELVNPENVKALCEDDSHEKLHQLDEYGVQYAKAYDRFGDMWVKTSTIFSLLPEVISNEAQMIKRSKFIEISDPGYYYIVCIRDYRLKGDFAPLQHVNNEIKNIIRNKRKVQFLRDIEEDVYKEGLASNKFKIYKIQK